MTDRIMTIVTPDAERPISRGSGRCTYCKELIGDFHKFECVMNTRPVRLRFVFEYLEDMPASWDDELITFCRNEGSWCFDNIYDKLEAAEHGACLCGSESVRIEVVGPANDA